MSDVAQIITPALYKTITVENVKEYYDEAIANCSEKLECKPIKINDKVILVKNLYMVLENFGTLL